MYFMQMLNINNYGSPLDTNAPLVYLMAILLLMQTILKAGNDFIEVT